MKTCVGCGKTKPLDAFRGHPKSSDGKSSRCSQCYLDALAVARVERRQRRAEDLAAAGGKRCTRCGEFKPLDQFDARGNTIDGLTSQCLACDEKRRKTPKAKRQACDRVKRAYRRDPEKFKKRSTDYRKANPEKVAATLRKTTRLTRWYTALAISMRMRAKKTGRPFDLDGDFLLSLFEKQGGRCYWLGVPMVPSIAHRDPRRPSVDRLDQGKGYTRDNVVLTTMFANMGRSSLDATSFAAFVEELRAQMRAT